MTENLFSYGSLQSETVQLKTFGRTLKGHKDVLIGYRNTLLEIKDESVIATSGQTHYQNLDYTGNPADKVSGMVFTITEAELRQADQYEEIADYKRISVELSSGKTAWVFISSDSLPVMIKLTRTNSDNKDFIELVRSLDADLAKRDGDEHSFYAQFNKLDKIKHVVIAYENGKPVSCGAIKEFSPGIMEIKRMYTSPECRGKGCASKVLAELEAWASELSYGKCVLETGKRQPEAVALYEKNGYRTIPNYGQYEGIENSLCFQKEIKLTGI